MKLHIRPETAAEFPAIYELNALAFGQDNESRLVDKLRDTPFFIPELSIVAYAGEYLVGYILLTRLPLKGDDGLTYETLALAPVSVTPALHQMGVGGQLIRHALKEASALGFDSVIVLGHPEYYPKFGFEKASGFGIRTSYEVPDEAFMAVELVPGALKGKAGQVAYPKAFEEVG
ncbi:GNAT family N-acetyltransferase [Chitinophaga deserti]|uniref:GNAT family N-acetyltransferase n=1 Tax=Chitinophaga deserti TaxID=2164099 RepID=UPI000D6C9EA2|nr:N-acetyltransferase [Chitinophaga deserti]